MNLIERIAKIIKKEQGLYKVCFIKDEFLLDELVFLNEEEFNVLDKLYNGQLTDKIK